MQNDPTAFGPTNSVYPPIEREILPAATLDEAQAQLLALLKTHGVLDVTELLAQCCATLAAEPETDEADAAFLRAAQFHLNEAAGCLHGC